MRKKSFKITPFFNKTNFIRARGIQILTLKNIMPLHSQNTKINDKSTIYIIVYVGLCACVRACVCYGHIMDVKKLTVMKKTSKMINTKMKSLQRIID